MSLNSLNGKDRGSMESLSTRALLTTMTKASSNLENSQALLKSRAEKYLQSVLGSERKWLQAEVTLSEENGYLVIGHISASLEGCFSKANLTTRKFHPQAHIIQVLIPCSALDSSLFELDGEFIPEDEVEQIKIDDDKEERSITSKVLPAKALSSVPANVDAIVKKNIAEAGAGVRWWLGEQEEGK